MRHDTMSMPLPTVAANGAPVDVRELVSVSVFAGKPGANAPLGVTGKIQGSVHGIDQWIDIATLANADFVNGLRTAIDPAFSKVRFVTATFTSGDAVLIVSGKNSRTDR